MYSAAKRALAKRILERPVKKAQPNENTDTELIVASFFMYNRYVDELGTLAPGHNGANTGGYGSLLLNQVIFYIAIAFCYAVVGVAGAFILFNKKVF